MRLFTQRVAADDHANSACDVIALPWDTRQKSRFRVTLVHGEDVGIDVPRGQPLRHASLLQNDQGELLRIDAAPQTVLAVTATTPFTLLKAAYHLGNRHVPLMLTPDALYLEPDHVLAEMLQGLGLDVVTVEHPFEPESGAYHQHEHRLKPLHVRS